MEPTALNTEAPSFLRRPLAVRGIPILRDIRDLKADIPTSLLHENPPKFIPPPGSASAGVGGREPHFTAEYPRTQAFCWLPMQPFASSPRLYRSEAGFG